jgi:signal peptidase I
MRTWLKLVAWVGGILGALVIVLYAFFFDVWTIPSDDAMEAASIQPTLAVGDVIVVSRHSSAARGNLLRCPDPQAPGRFILARAIAVGGETIQLQDEVVTIDRTRLPSPRACDTPTVVVHDPQSGDDVTLNCAIEDFGERDFSVLRAPDHPEPPTKELVAPGLWYFVSDNRHIHVDSRDFGELDPASCRHVVFRLVSAAGFGDAKHRLSIIW